MIHLPHYVWQVDYYMKLSLTYQLAVFIFTCVDLLPISSSFLVFVGFEDYDYDDSILARVIAQSQHEYLASLKKNATSSSDDSATDDAVLDDSTVVADSGKGKSIMPKDGRH